MAKERLTHFPNPEELYRLTFTDPEFRQALTAFAKQKNFVLPAFITAEKNAVLLEEQDLKNPNSLRYKDYISAVAIFYLIDFLKQKAALDQQFLALKGNKSEASASISKIHYVSTYDKLLHLLLDLKDNNTHMAEQVIQLLQGVQQQLKNMEQSFAKLTQEHQQLLGAAEELLESMAHEVPVEETDAAMTIVPESTVVSTVAPRPASAAAPRPTPAASRRTRDMEDSVDAQPSKPIRIIKMSPAAVARQEEIRLLSIKISQTAKAIMEMDQQHKNLYDHYQKEGKGNVTLFDAIKNLRVKQDFSQASSYESKIVKINYAGSQRTLDRLEAWLQTLAPEESSSYSQSQK